MNATMEKSEALDSGASTRKLLYTAKTHTTGGRDGGSSRTSDGQLDVKLTLPGSSRPGTNPEATFRGRLVRLLHWRTQSRRRPNEGSSSRRRGPRCRSRFATG